jgi:hypothetical protein
MLRIHWERMEQVHSKSNATRTTVHNILILPEKMIDDRIAVQAKATIS